MAGAIWECDIVERLLCGDCVEWMNRWEKALQKDSRVRIRV